MNNKKTKTIVLISLMASLIFVATFMIKIPNPATGGYSHFGDAFIFLTVLIAGKKNGAIAASIGAGLADYLSGAALWILPTIIIKFIMAWIMGICVENQVFQKYSSLLGSVLAGIWQIVAYTLTKAALFNSTVAAASIVNLSIQTASGIIIYLFLYQMLLSKETVREKLLWKK